jgi:hypothetical protein
LSGIVGVVLAALQGSAALASRGLTKLDVPPFSRPKPPFEKRSAEQAHLNPALDLLHGNLRQAISVWNCEKSA